MPLTALQLASAALRPVCWTVTPVGAPGVVGVGAVAAEETFTVEADELLLEKLPSPPYEAVIERAPAVLIAALQLPDPLDNVTEQRVVDPSSTFTEPDGVPAPGEVAEVETE